MGNPREEHDGDCTIYSALENGRPEDGICTCGYGLDFLRRTGDSSRLYSIERRERMERAALRTSMEEEILRNPFL